MLVAKDALAMNRGNDHGFVFKRGGRAKKALAKQPRQTPVRKRNSENLEFPDPKRRLTESPQPAAEVAVLEKTVDVVQDISVPMRLRRPPEPTPLISRTRTRVTTAAGTPQSSRKGTPRRRTDAGRRMTRKSMGRNRRRSTFSMRGKRASSIGGGFKAMPHDSVNAADFYRHISPELPEPIRLRQLLAWCARRTAVAPRWASELPDHVRQLLSDAMREAVEDVHSAFEKGEIATSWYHRPIENDQAADAQELLPHPENQANAEAKEKLLARIARLQKENDAWVGELKRASTAHAKALDRLPKAVQTLSTQELDGAGVEPISRALPGIDWSPVCGGSVQVAEYVGSSQALDTELAAAEEQIDQATRDIEVQLDAFHLDMHCAHEALKAAQTQCSRQQRSLGFIFEQRRERALAVASVSPAADEKPEDSPARDPTRNLLRTLASTLSHSSSRSNGGTV
ncbi:hypothetical protein GGF46_003252 [Coemansia sp. RSA 552]|nr:hypothetical protein GGF46_003252 [Coemansia sp. RSA 552]